MKPCARKWQVEAARDGRLSGKDRDSAERHRDTCAECAQAARELAALSNAMVQLPALTRDPITVRRTRQGLLSALNDAVVEPKLRRGSVRVALGVASVATLLTFLWFATARQTPRPVSTANTASFVEVNANPQADWTEHLDHELDRIDFAGGSASFKVRPHPGRRVIISLPDGELEDLGTIFSVLVRDRTTKHVAVSEGRVSLRLRGKAETVVSAGSSWDAEGETPPAPALEAAPAVASPSAARPVPSGASPSNTRPTAVTTPASPAPTPPAASSAGVAPGKPDAQAVQAEDSAYLQVVALLRAGKQDEARAEAKQYLLHFPNGFRRVEVLNIVTR
ncbi:MAG: FecR domain-containing protein [Polyangiaceae bacterium]